MTAPDEAGPPAETPAQRRRRLAKVFGEVLPETTRDERDDAEPSSGDASSDAWLKAQVPPHHG
jgi:hypothetical protein